jgi:hypothetical protein
MKELEPKDFSGTVSGIDVIATPGQHIRCLAFIRANPQNEIQVTTESHQLQTALELASSKKARVEVSYEEHGQLKKLTRVQLLDRYFPTCAGLLPPHFDEPNNPYSFGLLPGAIMSISVRFNSGWVNAVSFWDERASGNFGPWPGCGNADSIHPRSFQYQNPEIGTIPFAFSYAYKATAENDPNVPWGPAHAGVVKSYSPQLITIGYTDGTSPDNENCLITVTITQGVLPSGSAFALKQKEPKTEK